MDKMNRGSVHKPAAPAVVLSLATGVVAGTVEFPLGVVSLAAEHRHMQYTKMDKTRKARTDFIFVSVMALTKQQLSR